jgi:hypothetical protein
VTKSTGLYASTDLDAELVDTLDVGVLVVPANNAKVYECQSYVDMGETYVQCHVEVIKTGKTGWVLKKWITQKH